MIDTRRTVTWECYALALNGFHERVLRSSCYLLIGLTRNLIFAGKVPFPRAGHIFINMYCTCMPRQYFLNLAVIISSWCATGTCLRISIGFEAIGDEGVCHLASVLRDNSSLTELRYLYSDCRLSMVIQLF